jgi:hypothetical protein
MSLMNKEVVKARIGKREATVLIVTALVLDLISIVPGIHVSSSVVAQGVIPYLFSRYGVNIFSSRKVIPYIFAWLVELVPALAALPFITLETVIIIYMSRREDRKK